MGRIVFTGLDCRFSWRYRNKIKRIQCFWLQAEPYYWITNAETGLNPDAALDHAKYWHPNRQTNRSSRMAACSLIAHSAGSALIQAAADAIRTNSPSTVIQTTFLDPIWGRIIAGCLGMEATPTGLMPITPTTSGRINLATSFCCKSNVWSGCNAYNVDVTCLTQTKKLSQIIVML